MSPTNDTTNAFPTANVEVSFSEAMDLASLTPTTVTLAKTTKKKTKTAAVLATVSYGAAANRVVLDPSGTLSAKKVTYTVTVTTGAKDAAGNALAAEQRSSFKVAKPKKK